MTTTTSGSVYEADVLAALRQASADAGVGAPATNAVAAYIKCPDGHISFSDKFGWVPEYIPDVPLRVYDDSDWHESIRPFIPELPKFWVWPRRETEMFALAMYCKDRTLLYGPTGSGKSVIPQAWGATFRWPMMRINCVQDDDSTKFLGTTQLKVDPDTGTNVTGHEHTMVTLAAKHGGLLVIDEAFRSGSLMSIQALLEQDGSITLPDAPGLAPEDRKLKPDPDKFHMVLIDNTNGTGDTSGSYNAMPQDISTLDRLTATIYVPYPDAMLEEKVLLKSIPNLDKAWATAIVQIAQAIRTAFIGGNLMLPLSIRATMAWASKAHLTGSLARGLMLTYGAKLSRDDLTVLGEIWHQHIGTDLPTT